MLPSQLESGCRTISESWAHVNSLTEQPSAAEQAAASDFARVKSIALQALVIYRQLIQNSQAHGSCTCLDCVYWGVLKTCLDTKSFMALQQLAFEPQQWQWQDSDHMKDALHELGRCTDGMAVAESETVACVWRFTVAECMADAVDAKHALNIAHAAIRVGMVLLGVLLEMQPELATELGQESFEVHLASNRKSGSQASSHAITNLNASLWTVIQSVPM